MPNDGGPAFPVTPIHAIDPDHPEGFATTAGGMSLRDYFAGQALTRFAGTQWPAAQSYAKWCYEVADAMLRERAKGQADG